jgi:valyl-tRNA synthetase
MTQELPKAYDPKAVDPKWYGFWMERQLFKADAASTKPPYCIVMPPPNVTGVLHMGHALVSTLQDILIRWKRMSGYEVLWVPGTDHAGIATQTVVERYLFETTGKKRADFSREEFLKATWKWKEDNESTILNQLKQLGCSCDWSRLRFTMDEQNNRAVRTMFKKLYDEGLIYRGDYLVNWDPVAQTAIADDEVEHEEKNGWLWHFKYPLEDGFIEIATTRPETMLGDTAVAVSPKDGRYKHLIGKLVDHPLTHRKIPVIADNYVDPSFGTGVVKITPAHDPNDYQIGLAHKLPLINIMTKDGRVNENGGEFAGMSFTEARASCLQAMKAKRLFVKAEPHVNRVGVSYRSKAVIEPYLSKQWFVRMSGFAAQLREMVEKQDVKLIPEDWDSTYFHWIDHLRDWCISRQLWWGHRIPIWYKRARPEEMICFSGQGEPDEVKRNPHDWVQDPDVLDTWFSSALWPFSTLGWPDKTPDLERFYPNSTLITGHDILFFWVARMLAMGTYAMSLPPFPETYLHGLIYGKSYWRELTQGGIQYVSSEEQQAYDRGKPLPADVQFKWEKMSKSKGNVIDPIEIIEEFGTDAMRMTLSASASQAREIDLDRRRFEEFRNFANKIWNGARFVMMNLAPEEQSLSLTCEEIGQGIDLKSLPLEDRWILAKLARAVAQVASSLASYQFDKAALTAYDFFWKEFCAYYVECAKPYLFQKTGTKEERKTKQSLLLIVLCQAIRLLHPMAPFITEELFQRLKNAFPTLQASPRIDPLSQDLIHALSSEACAAAPFPQKPPLPFSIDEAEWQFQTVEDVIYAIRNVRGEMNIPPATAIQLFVQGSTGDPAFALIQSQSHLISALVRIQSLDFVTEDPHVPFASTGIAGGLKLIIVMPEILREAEKKRLEKESDKLKGAIDRIEIQLNNPGFVERAPKELIAKQRSQLEQGLKELEEIQKKLHSFLI